MLPYRTMNVRRRDSIVDVWAGGNNRGLDDAWTDGVLPDLGSDYGAYE
ncbi:hypothetical protein DSC45_23740 [Streptomyces sp. YIM 130001]|nr:hypothetical protein DSC45_23740 [Streptomyces sp. YIM 130001]